MQYLTTPYIPLYSLPRLPHYFPYDFKDCEGSLLTSKNPIIHGDVVFSVYLQPTAIIHGGVVFSVKDSVYFQPTDLAFAISSPHLHRLIRFKR